MKYKNIGNTIKNASVVTFGAMGIGGGSRYPDADDTVSIRAIEAALDKGINLFDTAPVYGFGHSEEVIGKALRGKRDSAIISTKCGLWWGDDEGSYRFTWDGHAVKRNLSPRTIRIEIEESLRRLGTDYIDIYYTHNPATEPFLTPIDDTIDVLLALQDEGKILAIGASNCPPEDVVDYLRRGAVDIVQRKYNLLEREIEADILPLVESEGLSLHAYSPLASGLLSGRFGAEHTLSPSEPRAANPLWNSGLYPLALAFIAELKDIADTLGCSTAALSIAYLLNSSLAVNVISGIRKEAHLEDVCAAVDLEVPREVLARIRELSDGFAASRALATIPSGQ